MPDRINVERPTIRTICEHRIYRIRNHDDACPKWDVVARYLGRIAGPVEPLMMMSDASENLLTPPEGTIKRLMYVVSLPLLIAVYVTTPDIRKPRFRHCVPLTFLIAILWIAVFSYVMVWMIAVIGE